MFSRIAIVNRGEAAMRLIHAVRDLNAQAGPDGGRIATVALHTEGERRAMFVREADLAYDLGPAANRPYLDYAVLEKALIETGADAAWVGWGFVAEDPKFAELCARIGVTLHRPQSRGHAQARGQDRLQADRRGGRRPGRALERRRRRHPRGGHEGGRHDRLPADAQGDRRGRWSRHPDGGLRRRPQPTRTSAPGTRPNAPSAPASSSSSAWSPEPGTSRSR